MDFDDLFDVGPVVEEKNLEVDYATSLAVIKEIKSIEFKEWLFDLALDYKCHLNDPDWRYSISTLIRMEVNKVIEEAGAKMPDWYKTYEVGTIVVDLDKEFFELYPEN